MNNCKEIEHIIRSSDFAVCFEEGEIRSYRRKPTDKCKIEILNILVRDPILVWSEETPEDLSTNEVATGLWKCEGVRSEQLLDWLYLGGWSMCGVTKNELEDYAKSMCAAKHDKNFIFELLQRGTSFYIDAFFDNIEWDVWKRV